LTWWWLHQLCIDAKMITVANILLASILSGNCPVASFAEVVKLPNAA